MRFQFSLQDALKAMTWACIACLALGYLYRLGMQPHHAMRLLAAIAIVLAPFAAAGAMFDRMGTGILCGLAVVLAVLLFCFGAKPL